MKPFSLLYLLFILTSITEAFPGARKPNRNSKLATPSNAAGHSRTTSSRSTPASATRVVGSTSKSVHASSKTPSARTTAGKSTASTKIDGGKTTAASISTARTTTARSTATTATSTSTDGLGLRDWPLPANKIPKSWPIAPAPPPPSLNMEARKTASTGRTYLSKPTGTVSKASGAGGKTAVVSSG